MGLLKALGIEKEADAVSLSKEADLRAQAWRKALDEASREDAQLLAESWAKEGEKIVALLDPVGKNRWAWALARAMHDSDKAPDLVCAALWAASSAFPPQSALKKSAAEMLLRMFWASAEWRAVWPGRRAEGFDFMRGGAGARLALSNEKNAALAPGAIVAACANKIQGGVGEKWSLFWLGALPARERAPWAKRKRPIQSARSGRSLGWGAQGFPERFGKSQA